LPATITTELTDAQVARFRAEGYLVLDALTDQDEVAAIREVYDRLFEQRAGRAEGNQFDLAGADEDDKQAALPQILSPAKYAPELLDTRLYANAKAIAEQLLGDCRTYVAHAIFKPPRHGAATPWHQDGAYAAPDKVYRHVNFWVPLQEATVDNGCLHFVPGSHRSREVLPHRPIGGDPRVHGLELEPDQMHRTEGAVAAPLPPGGATLHDKYTLHYAAANRSDTPRRALILGADAEPTLRAEWAPYPWLEQRQTARMQRAAAAGGDVKA